MLLQLLENRSNPIPVNLTFPVNPNLSWLSMRLIVGYAKYLLITSGFCLCRRQSRPTPGPHPVN